jgi:hypothetical protein
MHVLLAVSKEGTNMKIVWNIVGILLILAGGLWFLQGVNVLPGSYMSGQSQWAIYGGLALLLGAGLIVYVDRRVISRPRK